MTILNLPTTQQLEIEATTLPVAAVAGYLQKTLGQRTAAHLVGLRDAKQIGRYRREGGPHPHRTTELRLREAYKLVRMIADSFDQATARAWLFGTNIALDDRAPIDVVREAVAAPDIATVIAAARSLVASDS